MVTFSTRVAVNASAAMHPSDSAASGMWLCCFAFTVDVQEAVAVPNLSTPNSTKSSKFYCVCCVDLMIDSLCDR